MFLKITNLTRINYDTILRLSIYLSEFHFAHVK